MKVPTILLGVTLCWAGYSTQDIPHARTYNQLWDSGAQHEGRGEFEEALKDFREAAGRALKLENAANAYVRMGKIYEKLDPPDRDAALTCYHHALERSADAATRQAIVQLQKDRVGRLFTSSEILRALRPTATRSQIVTSADIYVNFEFNKDTLTVKDKPAASNQPAQVAGVSQVEELARSLADPGLANDRFEIDGHTDLIGPDDFNLKLSVRRAQRVKDALVAQYGFDSRRLDIKGFGSQYPLQPDKSFEAGFLNRRVSVTRLPGTGSPG